MPLIQAYHVSDRDDLQVIRPHRCDSGHYDGLLFGAEVASFTTTTWNGGLPTITQYPHWANGDDMCSRYSMHFDPDDYYKFQMSQVGNQVHFLLLSRTIASEKAIATFIRPRGVIENHEWDRYFPGGQPNDYATDNVFVNVFFMHDVAVKLLKDRVRRSNNNAAVRNEVPEDYDWLGELPQINDAAQGLEDIFRGVNLN